MSVGKKRVRASAFDLRRVIAESAATWRADLDFENWLQKGGKALALSQNSRKAHGFIAAIFQSLQKQNSRTWLICQDARAQESLIRQANVWGGRAELLPDLPDDYFEEVILDSELIARRSNTLEKVAKNSATDIIATLGSLRNKVPSADFFAEEKLELKIGDELAREDLVKLLKNAAYTRSGQARERGQFAMRGGIADIFPWQARQALRIEFFDDEIESMRHFEPESQLSVDKLERAQIDLRNPQNATKTCPLYDYFTEDDFVIFFCDDFSQDDFDSLRTLPSRRLAIVSQTAITENKYKLFQVFLAAGNAQENPFGILSPGEFTLSETKREMFGEFLHQHWREDWRTFIFFAKAAEEKRFFETLGDLKSDTISGKTLEFARGELDDGFYLPNLKLAVFTDNELLGRQARSSRAISSPYVSKIVANRHADLLRAGEFGELEIGDYVAHRDHGIGKYEGIQTRKQSDGTESEVMIVSYAQGAKLYLTLEMCHLLTRYIGAGTANPPLAKLGQKRWQKTKEKAEDAAQIFARELLFTQARRESSRGIAHAPDTVWQKDFEDAFVYQETDDQLRAIAETKADMESSKPMERLICGDVGFGKTEVAIRAIFKAVMGGYQSAFLAPTTVLSKQHFRTLKERFSEYPIRVELLNRFQSPKKQREILCNLRIGVVDVVVGTHRLISSDVVYKNIGLAVIDEEQRFGVKHKERFKKKFKLVDVLSLSATPIPRTLYLSLAGARKMSRIDMPPSGRLAIKTMLRQHDNKLIKKMIDRELRRGGQVYFLHNRIASIEKTRETLQALCPQAKMQTAHGRMPKDGLDQIMSAFVAGKIDVLVATSIVESGLDIPNANTIIIDRSDRFGLADLYQLRGRVGRSGVQAYALLLLPGFLGETAQKRAAAIGSHSSLGDGFKVAMRDLEIRGAGNLLGSQQSGHIAAVGFELYCRILRRAIVNLRRASGEASLPSKLAVDLPLHLDFVVFNELAFSKISSSSGEDNFHQGDEVERIGAFIPLRYIGEGQSRVACYKVLAESVGLDELAALRDNWTDRFGAMPEELKNLFMINELRARALAFDIESIEVKSDRLMIKRGGSYLQTKSKFPRLKSANGRDRLQEVLVFVKNLTDEFVI